MVLFMKTSDIILCFTLIIVCTCGKKTSDHSSPEPDVVSIGDTTSDESSGYDSSNYELSDCDSMKGRRSRCNSLESEIYSLFNQYKTDDGKIVISYPYSITSLFGLHIRREEALPTDVAYEDFTHYNPVLLEKIRAALDIPFVQKIIRLADTIVLENHAAGIKLNKELIKLETEWKYSVLLNKIHLNTYPQELKKYLNRYTTILMAKDTAIVTPTVELDVGYDLSAYYISFWIRRYLDGTVGQFESIIRKVIQILDPQVYASIDSIGKCYGKHDDGQQVIFAHDSYAGDDRIMNIFPGANNLLLHHSFLLDSLSRSSEENFNYCIEENDAESVLRQKSGCTMFGEDYSFYGIVEKGGQLVWTNITPEYSICFNRRLDECGEYEGYNANLTITAMDLTSPPPLLSASRHGSPFKPEGKAYWIASSVDSSTIPTNDTTPYTIITHYSVGQYHEKIKKLWSVSEYPRNIYDDPPQVKHAGTYLIVQWANNTIDTLQYKEHVSTINNFNAEIENVMITDVNGDKLQDIYFSTRDKAKWIGIMNTDFSISITCIKHGKNEDRC